MDKKEYIVRMLEILENTRPLARGLRILIQSNPLSDGMIDLLIHTFQEAIKGIQDIKTKEKLEHATLFLQELKEKEMLDRKNDELDIKRLEELLMSI